MERQHEDLHCRSLAAHPRCSRFVLYLTQRASPRRSGTPKHFPRPSIRRVGPSRQVKGSIRACGRRAGVARYSQPASPGQCRRSPLWVIQCICFARARDDTTAFPPGADFNSALRDVALGPQAFRILVAARCGSPTGSARRFPAVHPAVRHGCR